MMRLFVFFCLVGVFAIAPLMVDARGLVPCGGPGEPVCQSCHVVALTNNIIGWLVLILGTIAAIVIVYAGVKLVTSAGNQGAMEEAKSLITNIIIGYVIVLAGWLIIDYVMEVLVDEGRFGVWNQLECTTQVVPGQADINTVDFDLPYIPIGAGLSNSPGWTYVSMSGSGGGGGDSGQTGGVGYYTAPCTRSPGPAAEATYSCAAQQAQCTGEGGIPTLNANRTVVTCTPRRVEVNGGTGGNLPQCTNSACSVSVLRAAGLSSSQANVMSCIAMTESSGNPNARSGGSSACGTFQITRPTWSDYNPGGSCANHGTSCTNATCNIRTMVNIVRSRQYGAWTCPGCNARASQCISRYGG